MKSHQIDDLADFLKLDSDEFFRMLPDFIAWYEFGRKVACPELIVKGFQWIDDAKPGEIVSCLISINETGETVEFVL